MRAIKNFVREASQLRGINKIFQAKDIKRALIYLNKKLDSTIKILEFDFMVDFNARADNDNKKIIADIEGLFKYFKIIGGLTDMSKTFSKVFEQLSILNNTENQMITDQKSSKQSENPVPATLELEDIKVPLIEVLSEILKKRVNTYQTAEHIKRIYDVMLDRAQCCTNISQLTESSKSLYTYEVEKIEKCAIDLNKKLNSIIPIPEFYLMFDFDACTDNDNKTIIADIEDLSKCLERIIYGLTDTRQIVSKVLEQLSVLNNTVNQMITDQESDKQGENSANFLPFIESRSKILKIGEDMYQTVKNIEEICDRVQSAGREVENLKNSREKYKDFFSKANAKYIELQKLANNVDAKDKFLTEQLKELDKRDIKKATIYLNKEFDSTIQLLKFDFIVNFYACADRNNEKFRDNFDELIKELYDIEVTLSKVFEQLSVLNSTVNQLKIFY
ncbi:unnamed protein product [Rhizophagus irregularis]|nr:unnamed protein product [Rhizophagus irregularis]